MRVNSNRHGVSVISAVTNKGQIGWHVSNILGVVGRVFSVLTIC